MVDGGKTVFHQTREKKISSISWAAYMCSAVGFVLMSVMCLLYIHRCYTLRNAQARHQVRLEFGLGGLQHQNDQQTGPECATLIQAYGFSSLDDGSSLVPHKTVYSSTSKSCYCSAGKLDLENIRLSKVDSLMLMEPRVYIYATFSCEEVQRFNAYAAVFNGTVAVCWLVMMYSRARRKKVKSTKQQCMCGDEDCYTYRTLSYRTVQAKV